MNCSKCKHPLSLLGFIGSLYRQWTRRLAIKHHIRYGDHQWVRRQTRVVWEQWQIAGRFGCTVWIPWNSQHRGTPTGGTQMLAREVWGERCPDF